MALDGGRYHLKVNHVPDVTVFVDIVQSYLDLDIRWASEPAAA